MKRKNWLIKIIILIGLLLTASCIMISDSPAPGCKKYLGCAPMGGCSGKTIIQDMVVEGAPECLKITVNNCNGGVITIENACDDSLYFEEVSIDPGEYAIFDIEEKIGGGFAGKRISSNFSEFIPQSETQVDLFGNIGELTIRVSFTKTAPLCQ
jgi:hypothetical protein